MQFRGKEAKHVNFLGDWIFLNDILLHTSIYEANESHTVFSMLVKIDGQICQLLFTIEKIAAGYYQYIPFVIDIYGNIHYGPETVVYFDGEQSMLQNPSAK